MITNTYFVSVVITGKNVEKTVSECLQSIIEGKYPSERFEIIYVDAESEDGSLRIVRNLTTSHRNIRCFVETGPPGKGRNTGIAECKGQIISFTDADCVVDTSWLTNIVKHLSSEPEDVVGVGGPAVAPISEAGVAKYIDALWQTRFGIGWARNPARYKGSRLTNHNPTCNSAYRRWIFDKIGMFNEKLPVTEDEELDTRIRRLGYRLLYADDVTVFHHRKQNLRSFAKQMYSFGFWRALSGKKGLVPLKPWHLGPTLLIFGAISFSVEMTVGGPFFAVLMALLIFYLIIGCLSGAFVARRTREIRMAFIIPLLGSIQHFFYGIGFLVGLFEDRRLVT